MSEALSYGWTREISGALYHLELTWVDIDLFLELLLHFAWSERSFLVTIFLSLYLSVMLSLFIGFRSLLVLPDPEPVALTGRLLDSPKSQIFIWQSWLMRMFDGFKSR